jgi:cystathionine beta-lyase/cystathionine gamma-synthase
MKLADIQEITTKNHEGKETFFAVDNTFAAYCCKTIRLRS